MKNRILYITLIFTTLIFTLTSCGKEKATKKELCNKWELNKMIKNDVEIPLIDTVRWPSGGPICENGQWLMVYANDSLIIEESGTYYFKLPLKNVDVTPLIDNPTLQDYMNYLGSAHTGTWDLSSNRKKLTVTNYLYEMIPGDIDILRCTSDELWLKQSGLEYHFAKI